MTNPYFNEFGEELPDSTPIAKPVRFNRPGSTLDEIRRNLGLASKLAEQEGMETFEEADDFDVGDDFSRDHPFAQEVDNRNEFFDNLRDQFRAQAAQPPSTTGGVPASPTASPAPAPAPTAPPSAGQAPNPPASNP